MRRRAASGWTPTSVAAPILVGAATLALGAVFYWSVRRSLGAVRLAADDDYPFAAIPLVLGSLPTFLHVLAFSLLTSVLGHRRRSQYARNCAAWAVVNAAFEIGQHGTVAKLLASQLDRWRCDAVACDSIARYFVHGTFDVADIVAGVLGGLLACGFLTYVDRHAESVPC